jgi:hypothetical protein
MWHSVHNARPTPNCMITVYRSVRAATMRGQMTRSVRQSGQLVIFKIAGEYPSLNPKGPELGSEGQRRTAAVSPSPHHRNI